MADYDDPRPSSQPTGSTEGAVLSDNLITLDKVMNAESGTEITNRKGKSITPIVDIIDGAENVVQAAVDAVASDTIQNTADIAELKAKNSVTVSDSAIELTQTSAELQTILDDSASILKAAAISAGTTVENVMLATNTTDAIVGYIYDADEQVTYSVPSDAQGKFIQSVVDGVLTTSDALTYELINTELIHKMVFFNVDAMKKHSSTVMIGTELSTLGYYSMSDSGHANYIVESGVADGLVDHDLGNGLIAKLIFDVHPTFEQIGGRLFESRTDAEFLNYDAGLVINNAVSISRINGIVSGNRGFANLSTGIVIDRPFKLDLGGLDWAGSVDNHFELVVSADIGSGNQALVVNSGVRNVHLYNFKMKCYTFDTGINGVRIGVGDYQEDTDNINSNCVISNVICERFYNAFHIRQVFLSTLSHCQAIDSQHAGYWFPNGGTSLKLELCNVDGGEFGFASDIAETSFGLMYSSMQNCVVENTTVAAYQWRNCNMSMISCGQENCSSKIIKLVGTGNLLVSGFDGINTNSNKPEDYIGVEPDANGRFGYSISTTMVNTAVTGFSGDKINWLSAPSVAPASSLSTARWSFDATSFKQDPTDCLDYESWKTGVYFQNYVPLGEQINSVVKYTRNDHAKAFIDLEQNTDYTITSRLTSSLGSFYFKIELTLGEKTIIDVNEVNAVSAAALDTTGNGLILHCDDGAAGNNATGNVYLKAFHKAAENLLVGVSNGVLTLALDANMAGVITIEKSKRLM